MNDDRRKDKVVMACTRNMGQETREQDFDGHTLFHSMTYTQKLTWLSELAIGVYMLARQNPGARCNAFFSYKGEKSNLHY